MTVNMLSDMAEFSGWMPLGFLYSLYSLMRYPGEKQHSYIVRCLVKAKTVALESILANILAAFLTKELTFANEVELASSQSI